MVRLNATLKIGVSSNDISLTNGSLASSGKSPKALFTASRTFLIESFKSWLASNWIMTLEIELAEVEVIVSIPKIPDTAVSIFLVTNSSTSAAPPPEKLCLQLQLEF